MEIRPASGPGSDTFHSPQAKALTVLAEFPDPEVEPPVESNDEAEAPHGGVMETLHASAGFRVRHSREQDVSGPEALPDSDSLDSPVPEALPDSDSLDSP